MSIETEQMQGMAGWNVTLPIEKMNRLIMDSNYRNLLIQQILQNSQFDVKEGILEVLGECLSYDDETLKSTLSDFINSRVSDEGTRIALFNLFYAHFKMSNDVVRGVSDFTSSTQIPLSEFMPENQHSGNWKDLLISHGLTEEIADALFEAKDNSVGKGEFLICFGVEGCRKVFVHEDGWGDIEANGQFIEVKNVKSSAHLRKSADTKESLAPFTCADVKRILADFAKSCGADEWERRLLKAIEVDRDKQHPDRINVQVFGNEQTVTREGTYTALGVINDILLTGKKVASFDYNKLYIAAQTLKKCCERVFKDFEVVKRKDFIATYMHLFPKTNTISFDSEKLRRDMFPERLKKFVGDGDNKVIMFMLPNGKYEWVTSLDLQTKDQSFFDNLMVELAFPNTTTGAGQNYSFDVKKKAGV